MKRNENRPRQTAPDSEPILVLGIGNLVLNDEGIGIHIVHTLVFMSSLS